MDIRTRGVRAAAALMMVVLLLLGAASALADADPIRVSSLSEPQSVIAEQDVSITIKIYNSSQTDMQEEISLYNPDGYRVDSYTGLKAENSVTYTGTWHVTAEQIKAGKIKYYIRYMVQTDNGPQETTRTVPVTIQTEEAAPQLSATYSVSPASAKEGQTVTLSYVLSNIGNIELRNIVIENEGVKKENVTAASLSVSEKITLEDTFVMGAEEVVSKPTVHYEAAGSNKRLTISDMARKTIAVAEDGLEVVLKPSVTENVYPGESVKMTLEMKNSGNTGYSELTAQLSDGTQIASGVELAPGASHKAEFEAVIAESGDYSVSVTGRDSNGENVGVISEAVAITTQDASRALVLNVRAQAREETIYSEPAVVRFAVVVENTGETDATTLTVRQAGTKVAEIPSLPSGESRTLVLDLETSIAGKFQFTVSGKDAAGVEKTYESNILQVAYLEPTPAPTAAPTPTRVPPTPTPVPTATPEPSLKEIITDKVQQVTELVTPTMLYAVAGTLAGLLALILAVSGVKAAKRAKIMKNAIDTLELTPDVRNHKGVRRKDKKGKPEKKAEAAEQIVQTTELTEEEAAPAQEPAPAPEEGRRRRAPVETPVSTDETLRVMPVDQRPEFIAQGRVDDSQTRIFGKAHGWEEAQPAAPQEETQVVPPAAEQPAAEPQMEETIRLSRQEMNDALKEKAAKAEKPKKKKGLFGRRKDEDEDFVDSDEAKGNPDDDFFD
ncbi:MAG: hypothetical protein J6K32_00230 [Clostridia bacterium]|nr:hypothetical protein [Clostridia bacterium]